MHLPSAFQWPPVPVQERAFTHHHQPQRRPGVQWQAGLGGHCSGGGPGGCSGAFVHGGINNTSCQEAEEEGSGVRDHEQLLQE